MRIVFNRGVCTLLSHLDGRWEVIRTWTSLDILTDWETSNGSSK